MDADNNEIEVYSPFILSIYNYFVLNFFCPYVWGCSKKPILDLYNQFVTAKHVDIGVGTGYFLEKCQFPPAINKITLVDLNDSCLDYASRRIKKYQPQICKADIYQPLPLQDNFTSASMTLLLHCLPGNIKNKEKVFENIKTILAPNAILFGATVLGKDIKLNLIARKFMKIYNHHRIFCNLQDDLSGLANILKSHFIDVELKLKGSIALFSARNP